MNDSRPHPRYRASRFRTAFCDDPDCGLHLTAYKGDEVMSEIVMSPTQTLAMMDLCKEFLYDKATRRSK